MGLMLLFNPRHLESGHYRFLIPKIRELGLQDPIVVITQNQEDRVIFGDSGVETKVLSSAPPGDTSNSIPIEVSHLHLQLIRNPMWQMHRYRALQMLNRSDPTGTFRFLEREVLLTTLVLRCLKLIHDSQPKLIAFSVTPHQTREYVLFSIASCLGIPTLFFQPCSFAPAMLPRSRVEQAQFLNIEFNVSSESKKTISKGLDESVRRARELATPVYIDDQRKRDLVAGQSGRWLRSSRALLSELVGWKYPDAHDFSGMKGLPTVVARGLQVLLSRTLANQLRVASRMYSETDGTLPEGATTYFLHYEPERTSNPEGGEWLTQMDLLLHLAGFEHLRPLVVKEHYSQTSASLRGFMGRSVWFYEFLRETPEITFLDGHAGLNSVMSKTDRVVTLTGTVAVEAAFAGTPAYHFGFPWWHGLPGTRYITSASEIIDKSYSQPATAEEIIDFLRTRVHSQMIPGISSENPEGRFASRFQFSPDFWEVSSGAVAQQIVKNLTLGSRASSLK